MMVKFSKGTSVVTIKNITYCRIIKFIFSNHYHYLTKSGSRIAVRSKVNDSLIIGMRIIDTIIPVGRGQRQLILGDRYTGKTAIFISLMLYQDLLSNYLFIDGFGSKLISCIYCCIGRALSSVTALLNIWSLISGKYFGVMSCCSSFITFLLPLGACSFAEQYMLKGYDVAICFDDLSKHSKSYRQISLILGKIPSRDAFPADIFNIHAALLERCGKLSTIYFGGSISCFPIIETINSDITEYIATNIISITDGQFYTNKLLFLDGIRPAIDTALSVSRIGSNAQSKLMKNISIGIKNELTYYRNNTININRLFSLNSLLFQDFMFISLVELSIILLLYYRVSILFNFSISLFIIHKLLFLLSNYLLYLYYIITIGKNIFSYSLYNLINAIIL